jgi:hypothetical protein
MVRSLHSNLHTFTSALNNAFGCHEGLDSAHRSPSAISQPSNRVREAGLGLGLRAGPA